MGIYSIQGIILWAAMLFGTSCIAGNGQGMWLPEKAAGLQAVQDSALQTNLEIEVRNGSAKVQIQSEEEYRMLVDWMRGFSERLVLLTIDLKETDVHIYLDELLDGNELWGLIIKNGGTISIKNKETFEKCSLTSFDLFHVSMLDTDVLNRIQGLKNITIQLDDRYRGIMPTEELLGNRECQNIVLLWEGGTDEQGLIREGEHPFDGLNGENVLVQAAEEENSRLSGIYRKNEGRYSITSYEFFRGDTASEVFLSVEDRETGGEGYFDMLHVPQERLPGIIENEGHRTISVDVNFDGYEDLIFLGSIPSRERYEQCIVYLWEESTGKFIYCETAPRSFREVETGRKRLTNIITGGLYYEDYYIYEYQEGVFREKRMEVRYTDYGDVAWGYYEDGKLLERLYLSAWGEDRHYIYLGRDGEMEVSKVPDDVEFNEIGKKFFPEFDFYFFG